MKNNFLFSSVNFTVSQIFKIILSIVADGYDAITIFKIIWEKVK